MTFADCPAYLDGRGLARCGLPAEVEDPYVLESTDGPVECARMQCPRGHCFNGPITALGRGQERAGPAGGQAGMYRSNQATRRVT